MPHTGRQKSKSGRSAAASEPDRLELETLGDGNLDDGADSPTEGPLPPPSNPDDAAAYVLVNRMLEASPGAREFAARDGVAVIIEVPSGEWVDPVAEAWRTPNGGGQRAYLALLVAKNESELSCITLEPCTMRSTTRYRRPSPRRREAVTAMRQSARAASPSDGRTAWRMMISRSRSIRWKA